jgi:hypothetical protein
MHLGPLQVLKRETWDRICQRLSELDQQVTDLGRQLTQIDQKFNQACLERDELKAEVERLQQCVQPYELVTPPKGKPTREAMFGVMRGWTTQFEVDGKFVAGPIGMCSDLRMLWHLDIIGGAANKRALELGPLEGAHTKTMIEHGAREVVSIEGFPACWLRCLIVKEAYQLHQAQFLFGNFCDYVADYQGPKFDFVLAAGVLYHQENPARLILDLARLTDQVLVWSQVADETHPNGAEATVEAGGRTYRGRINDYLGARRVEKGYCGGLHSVAFWMYPEEMRRAFIDAGFRFIVERRWGATPSGPSVLFVASKYPCGQTATR